MIMRPELRLFSESLWIAGGISLRLLAVVSRWPRRGFSPLAGLCDHLWLLSGWWGLKPVDFQANRGPLHHLRRIEGLKAMGSIRLKEIYTAPHFRRYLDRKIVIFGVLVGAG